MIVDQLNKKSYKNTYFYEKNENIFLRLNLDMKNLDTDKSLTEDINLGNTYEIMAKASQKNTEEEMENRHIDGSYLFLKNILGRLNDAYTDYDDELIKQPYAESFLKVIPPLVTATENRKEIVWNLENMKEKESMGKLIEGLNLNSENALVKQNLETLNQYIYSSIQNKILSDSKFLDVENIGFPIFYKDDFVEILNKRKFKNILQEKEKATRLEATCEKLSNNLNLYFGNISKKNEFSKHFVRFKKYIIENPNRDLKDLVRIARKRKPKRDILKLKINELKNNFNISARFTAERILNYSLSRLEASTPKIVPLQPKSYFSQSVR